VGGKLLTNQLKELVSYRQWNMMDETFIVNDVKEKCCFVSENFKRDLEICRPFLSKQQCLGGTDSLETLGRSDFTHNSIVQEYILPDLSRNQEGRVRDPNDVRLDTDQVLVMNNERFVVPEILFRPDDIGGVYAPWDAFIHSD
jgi:actin-related protein 6